MGDFVGSIVDQTGAPLPGVHVTIRVDAVRVADTGAAGQFAFSDLPQGYYEISAELGRFQPERRAMRVHVGESVTVSFTLRLAILEETIVAGTKSGERDVQAIPIAVTAVSNTELGRLGTDTLVRPLHSHRLSPLPRMPVSVNCRSAHRL